MPSKRDCKSTEGYLPNVHVQPIVRSFLGSTVVPVRVTDLRLMADTDDPRAQPDSAARGQEVTGHLRIVMVQDAPGITCGNRESIYSPGRKLV